MNTDNEKTQMFLSKYDKYTARELQEVIDSDDYVSEAKQAAKMLIENARQREIEKLEKERQEAIRRQAILEAKNEVLKSNAMYEYATEYIYDRLFAGELDKDELNEVLTRYANAGWRLHTMVTNELGKNGIGVNGVTLNATTDVTILVFERCIKPAEYR